MSARLVAAAVVIYYVVLGLWLLSPESVYSGDIGVKYVQARALADQRFTTLDIPYPGEFLDKEREFVPLRPPFVMATRGTTQAIFPPASAVIQAVAVSIGGFRGLIVLSIVSAAVVLVASWKLAPAEYRPPGRPCRWPWRPSVVLRRQRLGACAGRRLRRRRIHVGLAIAAAAVVGRAVHRRRADRCRRDASRRGRPARPGVAAGRLDPREGVAPPGPCAERRRRAVGPGSSSRGVVVRTPCGGASAPRRAPAAGRARRHRRAQPRRAGASADERRASATTRSSSTGCSAVARTRRWLGS